MFGKYGSFPRIHWSSSSQLQYDHIWGETIQISLFKKIISFSRLASARFVTQIRCFEHMLCLAKTGSCWASAPPNIGLRHAENCVEKHQILVVQMQIFAPSANTLNIHQYSQVSQGFAEHVCFPNGQLCPPLGESTYTLCLKLTYLWKNHNVLMGKINYFLWPFFNSYVSPLPEVNG